MGGILCRRDVAALTAYENLNLLRRCREVFLDQFFGNVASWASPLVRALVEGINNLETGK